MTRDAFRNVYRLAAIGRGRIDNLFVGRTRALDEQNHAEADKEDHARNLMDRRGWELQGKSILVARGGKGKLTHPFAKRLPSCIRTVSGGVAAALIR